MAMTETMTAPSPLGDSRPQRPRRHWGVALKALQRLLADKEDTGQVFEIMGALNGDSTARSYRRLLETPNGGRLAYEHVELAPRLMDDAWLDSFAPAPSARPIATSCAARTSPPTAWPRSAA